MPDKSIHSQKLIAYRSTTFRLDPRRRVKHAADALRFVNERGFIFFWPVQGFNLPSLWTAHAGDVPVANEHDNPGHRTWGWKDDALDKRIWYYGKVLRRKATFISLDMAPSFYALSPNYGDPEEDYREQYKAGKLSLESKLIFETLLREGPLNTINLRKLSHLSQRSADYLFNKNIDLLQSEMKIMPIGVAEAGAWNYSYIYDLTHRHFPDLPAQAQNISESSARKSLILRYMLSVGCASRHDLSRLFQWLPEMVDRSVLPLVKEGLLVDGVTYNNSTDCLALPELV